MKTLELGQEYPPFGEERDIDQIAAVQTRSVEQKLLEEESTRQGVEERPKARRDAHVKHHGLVTAYFDVEPAERLPKRLREGVFAEPGKSYPALIRFSGSFPNRQSDRNHDLRGMAIKLLDVSGERALARDKDRTHDFLLASSSQFFIRNTRDYLEFVAHASRSFRAVWRVYFKLWPPRFRLFDFAALIKPQFGVRWPWPFFRIDSPMVLSYFSQTPYRFRFDAVKYCIRPTDKTREAARAFSVSKRSPDYLRNAMMTHLHAKEATFDFCIQFQADADRMPIENPVRKWKAKHSAFVKIATITIPQQTFDTPLHWDRAEHLSFNPWRCLAVHKPLGGINRCRGAVYEAVSDLRHRLNRAPQAEPTQAVWDALATGAGVELKQLQLT